MHLPRPRHVCVASFAPCLLVSLPSRSGPDFLPLLCSPLLPELVIWMPVLHETTTARTGQIHRSSGQCCAYLRSRDWWSRGQCYANCCCQNCWSGGVCYAYHCCLRVLGGLHFWGGQGGPPCDRWRSLHLCVGIIAWAPLRHPRGLGSVMASVPRSLIPPSRMVLGMAAVPLLVLFFVARPCCALSAVSCCCVVLACAVPCCAALCCVVLCCAVPCRALPCCAALACVGLCHAVLCCAVLCCAVLCCVVPCFAVLCLVLLFWSVLCCAVLCCAVLCSAAL